MFLVLNNKSPFYQLVYSKDGKRSTISTGTKDKTQAEKFLKHFEPESITEKPKKERSINLSSFVKEYKNYISNTYSKAYLERAVTPSFNKLVNFLPDLPLEMISSRNIDQFISSIMAYSRSAASLYHRTLKAAFNKALAWNYIKENSFNKIKTPKVIKGYPIFINHSELQNIIEHTTYDFLKDIFTVAFNTGLRLGELINMKWDWINFEQNIITAKNSKEFTTKGKKERIIPMNQIVQTIMKKRIPIPFNNDFIFVRLKGIKLNEEFVSKSFKQAVRDAKLNDKIHFHSLRHSFASNLVQKGVSLYVVKELLGHEDIKTTQIYSHLQQENLSKAVNLL